jgi:glycerol kinase
VTPDAAVTHEHYQQVLPDTPVPGLVEFDARVMADAALEVAQAALAASGPVDALGVANQRGSTLLWDRATREPNRPGL